MTADTQGSPEITTTIVKTADGTINVERAGSGRPLLVISGSGSSLATNHLMLLPLRRAFDTIAFDHRGMGRSSCPRGPWTMADHARDCLAVLDACGLESVAVFGISFGGMVALELAVTAPERVECLCLCCTSAGGEAGSSYPLHLLNLLPTVERVEVSPRLVDSRFSRSWLAEHPFDRAVAERLEAAASAREADGSSVGYERQMAARATHDTAGRLQRLTMPVFVMAGRFDGIAPLANSEAIAARVHGAVLASYEGGHLFLAQDPSAFPDVVTFLSPSKPPVCSLPPEKAGLLSLDPPTLEEIRANRERLGDLVVKTPVRKLSDDALCAAVGASTTVWLKEELFQRTGSFKPRGTLSVMLDLDASALERGVTGMSAGNHAISLAYSAGILGTSAKVVMSRTASPFRIALFESFGGEAVFVDDMQRGFAHAEEIAKVEGRTLVHPFEGPKTALGTASVGLEFVEQVGGEGGRLDAVIVAAGGGGLAAGVSCAVKQASPGTAVWAVEPEGADSLSRSFEAGSPQAIDAVRTIADSLGSPRCEPYSFALGARYLDGVVRVSDDQIRDAMRLLFASAKLVTEPAGAAALAALMYPLRGILDGKSVGLILCGGNIDAETFGCLILPA